MGIDIDNAYEGGLGGKEELFGGKGWDIRKRD
jgi:hypothetical protein